MAGRRGANHSRLKTSVTKTMALMGRSKVGANVLHLTSRGYGRLVAGLMGLLLPETTAKDIVSGSVHWSMVHVSRQRQWQHRRPSFLLPAAMRKDGHEG